MNAVNSKLNEALTSIAPVIGSVTAKYYSKSKIFWWFFLFVNIFLTDLIFS